MIRMKYWGGSCSPYICYMRFSSIFSDEKSGIRIRKEKMIVHEVEFIALGQNLKTVLFKFSWSYVLVSHDASRMTKCWSQCHIFYIYRYVLGDVIPHDSTWRKSWYSGTHNHHICIHLFDLFSCWFLFGPDLEQCWSSLCLMSLVSYLQIVGHDISLAILQLSLFELETLQKFSVLHFGRPKPLFWEPWITVFESHHKNPFQMIMTSFLPTRRNPYRNECLQKWVPPEQNPFRKESL